MTELIFKQEDIELKLTCTLHTGMIDACRYSFKLMQRAKGKRKWQDIKGYEHQYRVNTDMNDILKYLSKNQVMGLALLEYKKYDPTENLFK